MDDEPPVSIADLLDPRADTAGGTASLRRMLRAVRLHLGMDIAFLTRFDGADREFRSVDSDLADPPLREGASVPLEHGLCAHVVAGRLPELMRNAADEPIVDLRDHTLTGFEALTRFAVLPCRPPEAWFAEAAEGQVRVQAEMRAAATALDVGTGWPDDAYLAINVSPAALLEPHLEALLADRPLDRLVLEITEHAALGEYARLARALAPLRARGLRVAIDDTGVGHASFPIRPPTSSSST